MRRTILALCVIALGLAAGPQLMPVVALREEAMPSCMCPNPEAMEANRDGLAAHAERRLKEASEAYDDALRLMPPREPSAGELAMVRKFAPIVMASEDEPFPLKDVAAIVHFSQPWIAYHLFWEDDIDFPDDNDPCDHEIVWVRLDETRTKVRSVHTYFHGRILVDTTPVVGRPRVVSQWGKHGTMPMNWRSLFIQADSDDVERNRLQADRALRLEEYNFATWQKLHNQGRDAQGSGLGKTWPLRFEGSWDAFIAFGKAIDLEPRFRKNGMVMVSYFNNAVINRHFIRYNFAAKTEWPPELCDRTPRSAP
jgi:hypothetical protein